MKYPADFMHGMPVYGFMHIATNGNWRNIITEQLEALRQFGLMERSRKIFVSIVGPQFHSFNGSASEKLEIIQRGPDFSAFEFPALEFLRRHCNTYSSLVYYVHSKGAFHDSPNTHDWRKYMEYFILERYRDCIDALGTHDLCGVNWQSEPVPHFSGNFWWARADYIRTLCPVKAVHFDNERMKCEMWVGTNPRARVKTFHQSGINHYLTPYPRNLYATNDGDGSAVSFSESAKLEPLDAGVQVPVNASGSNASETSPIKSNAEHV